MSLYQKRVLIALPYILSIFLLVLVSVFQQEHDRLSPPFTEKLKQVKRTLLPEEILPYTSFGFNAVLADFYWIRSIQDFVAWDGKEGFYIGYFKNITALDPRFEYPYLFSIFALPQNTKLTKDISSLDQVAAIAERGIKHIPMSWQIPFYLATQYHIFTKAYEPSESYLKLAASKEGAPDGVYLVYSTFVGRNLTKTKNLLNNPDANLETTRDLIKVIYNNTTNETIKKLAGKGIQYEAVSQMLEKGIIAYKERYKRYPKTIEEMLAVNFIKVPEELLANFTITINPYTGTFTLTEKGE